MRTHAVVITAAGLVFGCPGPVPEKPVFAKVAVGRPAVKDGQIVFGTPGDDAKPLPAGPTDDYIKVEIRGTIIFENGKGYSVRVQVAKDRHCTLSLVIGESKVLVRTLKGLTGKEAIVRGYLDRPGANALPSPGWGHTPAEFGRFFVRDCEVRAVEKK